MQLQRTTSRRLVLTTCQQCGAPFMARPHHVTSGRAKFCSTACRFAGSAHPRRAPADRFWPKVDTSAEHGNWLWTGHRNRGGYGVFNRGGRTGGLILAHVFAWELASGAPIPEGFKVCHGCPDGDEPGCVRNDEPGVYIINGTTRPRYGHLWLGTQAENIADAINKGTMQPLPKGERHHRAKLTEPDVRDIRLRYADGGIRQSDLALEYGVPQSTISQIVLRKIWAHVI